MGTRHVVLTKPGDVLLIGNVGLMLADEEGVEGLQRAAAALRDTLGISVVLFEADIDLDSVSGGSG